jgi:hypothetical protein
LSEEHQRLVTLFGRIDNEIKNAQVHTVKFSALPATFFDGRRNDLDNPQVIAAVDVLTQLTLSLDQQASTRRQALPLLRECVAAYDRQLNQLESELKDRNRQLSQLCNQLPNATVPVAASASASASSSSPASSSDSSKRARPNSSTVSITDEDEQPAMDLGHDDDDGDPFAPSSAHKGTFGFAVPLNAVQLTDQQNTNHPHIINIILVVVCL